MRFHHRVGLIFQNILKVQPYSGSARNISDPKELTKFSKFCHQLAGIGMVLWMWAPVLRRPILKRTTGPLPYSQVGGPIFACSSRFCNCIRLRKRGTLIVLMLKMRTLTDCMIQCERSMMMDTNRAAPSDTPTPPNTTHCCNDLLPGVHLALVSCSYHPLCRNDRSSKNGYICQNDGIMSRFPLISHGILGRGTM